MTDFQRAHELHSAGRLKEAEALYQKALQAEPTHEEALFWLAMLYTNQGRNLEAVDLFYRALEQNPNEGATYTGLGIALRAIGQAAEAENCFRRALEREPDTPELYFHLSSAQFAQNNFADALTNCETALALKPDFVEAHQNHSEILHRLGREAEAVEAARKARAQQTLTQALTRDRRKEREEQKANRTGAGTQAAARGHYERGLRLDLAGRREPARAAYRQALALSPDFAPAHNGLGGLAVDEGRWAEAEAHFRQAIALAPAYSDAHANLGRVLLAYHRTAEAEASYRKAIALQPGTPDLHANLASVLISARRFAEAETCARAALTLNPRGALAHNNLSSALFWQNRMDEARTHSLRAVELQPKGALFQRGLANVLANLGDMAGAEAAYGKALASEPNNARAHTDRGGMLLLHGDFARGWPEVAWARTTGEIALRAFPQPEWDGTPLPEGTVLVYATQGFGDMIQFARYLPRVKARVGRVVVECYPELVGLFQGIPGADAVVAKPPGNGPPDVEFDAPVSIMDLPRLFQTDLDTIPAEVPTLRATPEKRQKWLEQLQSETRLKVGISWAGRPEHLNDTNRSCHLADFAPLMAIPGVAFISLQKGEAAAQITESPTDWPLTDVSGELHDFTDTAGLLENLDLLISVDTSIVHLAGAMARPVWTLLPHYPDWRWLLHRADSPWYPTMRLFRQSERGNWTAVFREAAEALSKKIP